MCFGHIKYHIWTCITSVINVCLTGWGEIWVWHEPTGDFTVSLLQDRSEHDSFFCNPEVSTGTNEVKNKQKPLAERCPVTCLHAHSDICQTENTRSLRLALPVYHLHELCSNCRVGRSLTTSAGRLYLHTLLSQDSLPRDFTAARTTVTAAFPAFISLSHHCGGILPHFSL